jgi:hypothetical protein
MSKKICLLVLVVILASLISMACVPPPPPPPPPDPATCSPGFWKNHTQIWAASYPDDFDQMLADLQGGKDTRITRFLVAAELNAAFPDAPCD